MESLLGSWARPRGHSGGTLYRGPLSGATTAWAGFGLRLGRSAASGYNWGVWSPSPGACWETTMSEAFLLSAARTPIGKYLGGLADVPAPQLGAVAVAEALRRGKVPADRVDEVILGNVIQAGLGQNPARQAALKAGLPDTIAALTVNKVCGSGLKAAMLAAQAIRAGDAELLVAGGTESMSRAPYLLFGARTGWKFGDQKVVDAMLHDGLWCAFEDWHMGEAAEHIAGRCGISRAEQDRFAAQSPQRAAAAWREGKFA